MGWSEKYKKSINCDNPKGFSQRAHCQGRKKKMQEAKEQDHEVSMAQTQLKKSEENIRKLRKALGKKEKNIPAWVQAKITDTEHNTDAASSYMDEGKRDGKSAKDKDYSLRDWFKGGGWVQAGGKYDGKPCAKQPGQKTKPFCRDADDRAEMSKEERNKRAAKKRKEDPNPNRKGKAKFVTAEQVDATKYGGPEKLLQKLVDDKRKRGEPDGGGQVIRTGLQKAHFEPEGQLVSEGKPYKVGETIPDSATKPAPKPSKFKVDTTGLKGPEKPLGEEKDACYKKVKARYDVWPSAYASGALVKCRKVGAANWGNKTQKEGYEFSNWRDDFKPTEIETFDIIKPEPLVNEGLGKAVLIGAGIYAASQLLGRGMKKFVDTHTQTKPEDYSNPTGLGAAFSKKRTELKPLKQSFEPEGESIEEKNDPCWVGYKQVGMKKKGGKMVPNCIKEEYSNWRQELEEDWQKVNKGDKTDGMSQKAVDAYRRENPGSKLKTAVTEKDPGPGRSKRRKSFCARSKGQQDMHNIDCSKTPDKAICKARRRWRC